MKIVQTFWSANKSLLYDSFGWSLPEFHLMSWALSCMSLRQHYNEVVLYTDTKSASLLIDKLGFPYTDVIIQFDNLTCPTSHWAYPKILTYSLQADPFLHVDGDVYLPKPLNIKIQRAELVAQNQETGTDYYRKMVEYFLHCNFILPDWFRKSLEKVSVLSYNAGVLGGNDLDFIQQYCEKVFRILYDNRLLSLDNKHAQVSNNIIFEQILFATLVEKYSKEVETMVAVVVLALVAVVVLALVVAVVLALVTMECINL